MERKLTKKEFKAIRKLLGFTQREFAEFLGRSLTHINKIEHSGSTGYDVSNTLDQKLKEKLNQMGVNIGDLLKVAREEGMLE